MHPKAHLIPKVFFSHSDGQINYIYSSTGTKFRKKSRTGLYDPSLWCSKCEKAASDLDGHAAEVLLPSVRCLSPVAIVRGTYKLKKADSKKLHLFFLSVLWRMSSSSQSLVRNFNLQNLEESFQHVLIEPNAEILSQYPYSLSQMKNLEGRFLHHFPPHPENIEGVDFLRFKVGAYYVKVKVSFEEAPKHFRPFLNHYESPDVIVMRDRNEKNDIFQVYEEAVRKTNLIKYNGKKIS